MIIDDQDTHQRTASRRLPQAPTQVVTNEQALVIRMTGPLPRAALKLNRYLYVTLMQLAQNTKGGTQNSPCGAPGVALHGRDSGSGGGRSPDLETVQIAANRRC